MEDTLIRREEEMVSKLRSLPGAAIDDAALEWLTTERPKHSDGNDLPKKLRYSIVIHLFTTIETQGLIMCGEIAETVPSGVTPSDLKGSRLERIKTYLDKVCGVFPAASAEWERIHWIEKLRHVVVHEAGEVPMGAQSKFYRQLEKRGVGLTIDNARQIYLSRLLCSELIDATAHWFTAVYTGAGLSYEPWNDG